jgi:hypothetical protein
VGAAWPYGGANGVGIYRRLGWGLRSVCDFNVVALAAAIFLAVMFALIVGVAHDESFWSIVLW